MKGLGLENRHLYRRHGSYSRKGKNFIYKPEEPGPEPEPYDPAFDLTLDDASVEGALMHGLISKHLGLDPNRKPADDLSVKA